MGARHQYWEIALHRISHPFFDSQMIMRLQLRVRT